MSRLLLILSLLLAIGGPAFWIVKGAHQGWSQTSVKVDKYDEVLEMTYPTFEDRFLPGIDFLAAVLIAAFILFFINRFFSRSSTK